MNWRKLRAWIPAFAILEIGATIMSLAYMGKRSANTPGEGNKIARMVLDNPTDLESFLFYFILAHVLIGIFLFIGWVAARHKNQT